MSWVNSFVAKDLASGHLFRASLYIMHDSLEDRLGLVIFPDRPKLKLWELIDHTTL